jgi:hypothetical protein
VRILSERYLRSVVAFAVLTTGIVHADVGSSIVTIYCQDNSGSSQGTGFILAPEELIVTAYHVVQNAKTITVRDSSFTELPGIVVEYIDPGHDVAILKSEHTDLPGLTPTIEVQAPQSEIVVRGSPRGTPKQVFSGQITSDGKISSLSLSDDNGKKLFAKDIEIYTTDITLYSGMSGAPVLTSSGQVIGILSGSFQEGRGIGWAIPISYALDLLSSPPKEQSAGQIGLWPALDLMGPSWLSYKRSYGKRFDSEHIGELEILETMFRTLRGTWISESKGYKSLEECDLVQTNSPKWIFDRVDQDEAAIIGDLEETFTTTVFPQTHHPGEQERCNELAFADSSVSKKLSQMSGTLSLKVLRVESKKLDMRLQVTDCSGVYCKPAIYDEQHLDNLQIISESKLRSGDFILMKLQ